MHFARLGLGMVLVLGAAAPIFAGTVYVSDQILITLRTGQSTGSQMIRTIKTDTPLEVLEKGKDYFRVRTPEGEEGYVLSQYVTYNIPKSAVIAQLTGKVTQLQKMVDNLQSKGNDLEQRLGVLKGQEEVLRGQLAETERRRLETQRELEKVNTEFAALRASSESVVEVVSERDRLAEENQRLGASLKKVEAENADLFRSAAIKWFLAGGGVLAGGWVLGKMSRKKRSPY
ncbi:MAG: TIGR04211 family SH3 domain-containing protein [Deltaproteobacteria bacterium]|nr:TIGR04211 family SH3 domain-containing protein [Deltaproteobacteria bacterium]